MRKSKNDPVKVLALDIETTHLHADFGVILCAYAQNPFFGRGTLLSQRLLSPVWDRSAADDSAVVRALIERIAQADVLLAHNGADFDLPYIRSRAKRWGMPLPPDRPILDPCVIARKRLRLSHNTLASLLSFFDIIERKTPLDPTVWAKAALARDTRAMIKIERHCKADVDALVALAARLSGLWGRRIMDDILI
jgi:DNA polymerase elongation subunit (family B)